MGAYIRDAITDSYKNCGVCFQKAFGDADNQLILKFDDQLEAFSRDDSLPESLSCESTSPSILDSKTERQIKRILRHLRRENLKEHPALALFKKKCDRNKTADEALEKLKNSKIDAKNIQTEILRVSGILEKGTPIGISYDSTVVGAKNFLGQVPWHASSIVGQRTEGGVSYFIVRNSWGKDSCEQKLREQTEPKVTCDHGDFVVNAEALLEKTYDITYFE